MKSPIRQSNRSSISSKRLKTPAKAKAKASTKTKATATSPRARRLSRALSALAAGLANPWDESTDFFTPFFAALPDDQPLTADTLRAALKIGARYRIDLAPVDLAATADDQDDETGEAFRVLDAVIKATLFDVRRVSARAPGVVRVRTWLLGRHKGGWLVGLRTETTET